MNHYLLFYDVVDDFVAKRQPFREVHLAKVRGAHERAELILAGALADPTDSAVLLFRAESSAPIEAFAKTDPYVLNGLVTRWRVREWKTVVGQPADIAAAK
ncbi:MAG TPA: YciI-like protein [Vicinamibacterales bacterium]